METDWVWVGTRRLCRAGGRPPIVTDEREYPQRDSLGLASVAAERKVLLLLRQLSALPAGHMPRVPATCRTLLAPLTPHRLRPADSPPQLLEKCGQVNRNTACAQLSRSGRLLRTQRGGGRRRAPRRHYRRDGVAPCVTRTGGNAAGGAVGGSSMRTMCAIFANWPSMGGSACTSLVSALAHAASQRGATAARSAQARTRTRSEYLVRALGA